MMKRSTLHTFQNDEHQFSYTLHRKSGQKHRYIRIKDSEVIVTAPYTASLRSIQKFVEEKSEWISIHLSSLPEPYDLSGGSAHIYIEGIRYGVIIKVSDKDHLEISGESAIFHLSKPPSHKLMLDLLQKYYKQNAPTRILPKVEAWSDIMGLVPTKVSFRRAKTRWGSCSSRNTISLNTYMMMLPDHLIDYIVVHELAHIKHKNHSHKFWNCVEQFYPEWQKARKEIRKYEKFLT